MSIQSEIDRIKGNVVDAFTAIRAKGVSVSTTSNSDILVTNINKIVPRIAISTVAVSSGAAKNSITFSNIPAKPKAFFVYRRTSTTVSGSYYKILGAVFDGSVENACHVIYGTSRSGYYAASTSSTKYITWTWTSSSSSGVLRLTSSSSSDSTMPGRFPPGTYEVTCIY